MASARRSFLSCVKLHEASSVSPYPIRQTRPVHGTLKSRKQYRIGRRAIKRWRQSPHPTLPPRPFGHASTDAFRVSKSRRYSLVLSCLRTVTGWTLSGHCSSHQTPSTQRSLRPLQLSAASRSVCPVQSSGNSHARRSTRVGVTHDTRSAPLVF